MKSKSDDNKRLTPRSANLSSQDELEYALRGVLRLLARQGHKTGYFFERIDVKFASELKRDVRHEQTYLDHVNLVIVVELPDPKDPDQKEKIRSQTNRAYTFGADEYKTRAVLSAWEGLDQRTKSTLIQKEKELDIKLELENQ